MVQMTSSVMEARAWNPEEEHFTMLGVRKSFTGGQFSQLSKEGKEEPLESTARLWEYNREQVAGSEI